VNVHWGNEGDLGYFTLAELLHDYAEELEKKVAELTKKFETQRSARRKYKKQLNRLSGHVVKKAKKGEASR
jgi:flagellar capping protein FliD